MINIYFSWNKLTLASNFDSFHKDLIAWISSAGVRMVRERHISTPLRFFLIMTFNDAFRLVIKMIAFWTHHILYIITLLKTFTNCMYTFR